MEYVKCIEIVRLVIEKYEEEYSIRAIATMVEELVNISEEE